MPAAGLSAVATSSSFHGRLEMAEIRFQGVKTYPGGEDAYRDEVYSLVRDIVANPVGGVIAGAILRTPKLLTIMPESERPRGSFNPHKTYTGGTAATFPVDSRGKPDYAGASPKGLSREGKDRDRWYAGKDD